MQAKCTQRLSVSGSGCNFTFSDSEFYEFIRSLVGGTVIVKNGDAKIKLSSDTFDSHFISIQELRNDSLEVLLDV